LFFGRDGGIDFVEMKLKDPDKADHAMKLRGGPSSRPRALVHRHRLDAKATASYWGALQVERNVMRLILMMLVADSRAEHHLGPDHAGEKQGSRHRHPADHGGGAGLDPAHLLHGRRRSVGVLGHGWRA
jgi:hypothetical protein